MSRVFAVAIALALVAASTVEGATLRVTVRGARGAAADDAVVYAVPLGRKVPVPTKIAVMDQKNRQFVPRVLVVQTGTAVKFPNSDNVRHQVYSFSPAKKFQLPLYEGTPVEPVVFDVAGVVALGCNIHDRMSAWIVVVDTPHFAVANGGRGELADLPPGTYDVRAWYPGLKDGTKPVRVQLAGGETREVTVGAGSD